MSQTVISASGQAIGVAGQIFDNAEVQDTISGFSEEVSAEIAFGTGVVHGTNDQGVLIPTLITDKTMGVVVWGMNHQVGANGDLGTTGLKPKAGLQVMRKGRVLVQLDVGVVSVTPYTDRAFLRFAASGGNTVLGRWGKSTDAGNIDLTAAAVFVSSIQTFPDGTKGAVLEVDFTNKP